MKMKTDEEKKIYAREFHPACNSETKLALDVENARLIRLNDLELSVLKNINEKPASIVELKQGLPDEKSEIVEDAVDELIKVDMIGYCPFKKVSPNDIHKFERRHLENLKNKEMKQIALNVTHKCNLKCDYCYGGDGSYGGPAINMTIGTAERAVDFLMKVSGNSDECRITFFGGEPLLNFDLVKYVVEYSRKEAFKRNKKINFGMTTNGVLLDDCITDFIINEKIEVTFSLDGPKEIQDKNRRFKSNKQKSSYDLVFPKILKFIEKAEKQDSFYAFRATVTRPGILNVFDVSDFFTGFKNKKIRFDTAEYKNGISRRGLAITDDDLVSYRQTVRVLAEKYRENDLKAEYDLFSGPLKAMKDKTRTCCSCKSPGVLYVGVSAEGDIFPCHRFVGYKETKLGNVWQGFDREKWLKRYAKTHIFSSKKCSTCWLRYFCGGLCPATNYFLGGNLTLSEKVHPEPVHCKLKKIVYEEAMLLFASLPKK